MYFQNHTLRRIRVGYAAITPLIVMLSSASGLAHAVAPTLSVSAPASEETPGADERTMASGDTTPAAAHSDSAHNDILWWETFHDDALSTLIYLGLRNNQDIASAATRVLQAEAAVRTAMAALFPTFTWDTSTTITPRLSVGYGFGAKTNPTAPSVFYNPQTSIGAQWNLDVFGRQFLAYQAQKLANKASGDERDAIAMGLIGRIAEAYFDAVSAAQQVRILETQLQANGSLLEMVQGRYKHGDATVLDVLQQRQQMATTKAQIPTARAMWRMRQQVLAILVGLVRDDGTPDVDALPVFASTIPTVPAWTIDDAARRSLVDSLPALRAASERVASAEKSASSAWRRHLPTLNVNARYGFQARNSNGIETQWMWNAGGTLSVPLFSFGADQAAVNNAKTEYMARKQTLTQQIRQAQADLESALIREEEQAIQLQATLELRDAARLTFSESRERYIHGLVTYLNVLTAWQGLQQAEISVLQSQRLLLSARIQAHQALGGAWTQQPLHYLQQRDLSSGKPSMTEGMK